MSVLTGPEIKKQVESGKIRIDPWDPNHIGPNSVDLTLSSYVKVYVDNAGVPLDAVYREALRMYPPDGTPLRDHALVEHLEARGALLDVRHRPNTRKMVIPDEGLVLMPGQGYLGSTIEFVGTEHYVPQIHGRSSMGRLFFKVHETAGWGDIGFEGTWTLEISVMHPLRVYPNTRVCQIAFEEVVGERNMLYSARSGSKYNGQVEPGPSASFEDFKP